MNFKKSIAMALAITTLSTATISAANAGSFCDFIASAAKTVAHGVKTVGNAVIGTAKYAFTDKDASECYEDMLNSVDKVVDNACDIAHNTVQIGKDLGDLAVGSAKVIYGGACAAGTALYATEEWIRTGEKDFSTASSFVDTMKEGYKQADNGIFTDIAIVAGAAVGVPTYAIVAANVAKAGIEYAVDYKTGEETVQTLISSTVSAVSMGAGAAVGAAAGSAAGAVTSAVVSTGSKITYDIVNDKDDRSVLDIVLEDVCVAGANAAVGYAARKAGDALRGTNNAQDMYDDDDDSYLDDSNENSEASNGNEAQAEPSSFIPDDTSDIVSEDNSQVVAKAYDGLVKVYADENDTFLDSKNTAFNDCPSFSVEGGDIDLNTTNNSFVEDMRGPFEFNMTAEEVQDAVLQYDLHSNNSSFDSDSYDFSSDADF